MYDLSQIIGDTSKVITESAGKILGGVVGEQITDQSKSGVANNIPDWLKNTIGGFFKGFSSTEGGSDVIKTSAATVVEGALTDFFKSPLPWIILAGFAIVLVKK